MKANCWLGKKKVDVVEVPDPRMLNERDAIVRVTSTAICGSDLHLYNGFVPTMEKGDVLGHEFMGEVVEVGPGVKNLRIGDRVVVPFPIACGACAACVEGKTSLCENSNPNAAVAAALWGHSPAGLFGYSHMLGGYAGGQAEYVRVPFADVAKGPECVVSGGVGTSKVMYKGKEYYVCCTGCRDEFLADPEKYIKKAEARTRSRPRRTPSVRPCRSPRRPSRRARHNNSRWRPACTRAPRPSPLSRPCRRWIPPYRSPLSRRSPPSTPTSWCP